MASITGQATFAGGRRERAPTAWLRALRAWLLCGLAPVLLVAGFNIAVDAEGYFGLNDFGSYGGDEFLIKSSMVRNVEHDALLLGDSRASFVDVSAVGGYRFFNAGVGGGRLQDYLTLLENSDRDNLRLVVLIEGLGLSSCKADDEGHYGLEQFVAHALSFDALSASAEHLLFRWRGYLPDHRANGTRYPDSRLHIPFNWNGKRDERYLDKVADYGRDGPLENGIGVSPACRKILFRMRAVAEAAGAEFLLVLHPVNQDIVASTKTDVRALRRNVRERILSQLPFARDFTLSEYGGGRHYSPYDPVHFLPESGAELLKSTIRGKG